MTSSSPNPTAVLDTNLLVSAEMSPQSLAAAIVRAWFAGRFTLATSPSLVAEVDEVLHRPQLQRRYGLTGARRAILLDALGTCLGPALALGDLPLHCRDAKDDPVLAAALGAEADYLVTGDEDLLAFAGDPRLGRLRIVTPRQFLGILADNEP